MKELQNKITDTLKELPETEQKIYKATLGDYAYYRDRYETTGDMKYRDDIERCESMLRKIRRDIMKSKTDELIIVLGRYTGKFLKEALLAMV